LNHPFIKITCVCPPEAILNFAINLPASSDFQPMWWGASHPTALLYIFGLLFKPRLNLRIVFNMAALLPERSEGIDIY
jgi:hypothetical protein